MSKVRVALVGVGNCASSLVQGVGYYTAHPDAPGLMTREIGGYSASDIEFVAAFDVNKDKIGVDLGAAVFIPPTNAERFYDPGIMFTEVTQGPLIDGLGNTAKGKVDADLSRGLESPVDVLRDAEADVVVNFLPVGSQHATEYYAECAMEAGCAFVNSIPVFLARSDSWPERFKKAGVPLIGDDIKSQLGATIIHRELARIFSQRGIHLKHTYQLNVGGNMDFYNMLDQERLESKRESKSGSVTAVANSGEGMEPKDVHIGPSDYVEWLEDHKLAFINLTGVQFGGLPLELEMRLNVNDSPNSAGVVLDAIRYAKLAMDRGEAGALTKPSAWLMKTPPVNPSSDSDALEELEEWAGVVSKR